VPRRRVAILEELGLPPDWTRDALCQEYPCEWFFPDRSLTVFRAKAVCGQCLVRAECLDYCLSSPETRSNGIWAGTTPDERRRLKPAS